MEEELEAQCEEVNRRIFSGENQHVKLSRNKSGEIFWTLPYVGDEEAVDYPFFDELPQIHIAQLLQFVDSRCQCLDACTHILQRYVKTKISCGKLIDARTNEALWLFMTVMMVHDFSTLHHGGESGKLVRNSESHQIETSAPRHRLERHEQHDC